ncbi:MAG: hypothetical protein ACO4AG_12325 [Candidatus Nanopelagicales bacterium]
MAVAASAGSSELDWARAHGVDARSLRAWRLNLGRRRAEREVRLVELVPSSVAPSPARYALTMGDVRVDFDDSCSVETLRKIVQVLCAC